MEVLIVKVVGIVLGAALVLVGNKPKLFGATAGFVLGLFLSQQFIGSGLLALAAAGGAAVLGFALLGGANKSLRWLVRLVGAAAGAVVLLWTVQSLLVLSGTLALLVVLAAAVLIYIWTGRAYKRRMIAISALLGAGLLVYSLTGIVAFVGGWLSALLTAVVAVVSYLYHRRQR
jgi:hypothetical protein